MLKITRDIELENFQPWSGAVETFNRVYNEDKLDDLAFLLEDIYPDGITDTQLNDILWFEDEWLFEALGISEEEEEEE